MMFGILGSNYMSFAKAPLSLLELNRWLNFVEVGRLTSGELGSLRASLANMHESQRA